MQLKRFLGNLVKASLAMGALAVPAFAGADTYYDHGYNGQYHDDGAPCCPSNIAAPGCCYTDNCCGFPVNPAPECGFAYSPPAYARCGGCENNCCNSFLDSFAFRADFLWWRACVEGIELGSEETVISQEVASTPPRTFVTNRSHEKHSRFKYDPGFRLGLANACACDCWDFAVNWTHFRTKAKANGFSDFDAGIIFVPNFERIIDAFPLAARGRYTLNIDLVDIEFGRKFYVSSCFVLRPDFGLRVARIHQNYRADFLSATGEPSTGELVNYESNVKSRSNFLAVGPRVGLDLELDVACGLILFGQAHGSIVFGKFNNHSREHLTDFTTTTGLAVGEFEYEAHDSGHRCSRAITDLAFGVKWQRCLQWCNRSHPVSLAFAWEHHGFFNMQNFNFNSRAVFVESDFAVDTFSGRDHRQGDIFTQGLTVSLAFGF